MEQFSTIVPSTLHTRMKFSIIACKGKGNDTLGVDGEEEIHKYYLSTFNSSPPPQLEPEEIYRIICITLYTLQMSHAGAHMTML